MPVRVRLVVLFATATLVLVAVGGTVFARSLRHGLVTSLDPALRTRADALSQTVKAATTGIDFQDAGSTRLLRPQDAVAQVLDPNGGVVEASEEAGTKPLVSPGVIAQARRKVTFTTASLHGDRYRVLATSVRRSDGLWTVAVASSLESADDAVHRVNIGLVVGGAGAVALAGIGAWFLASAALRPVERMRRKAADISEHDEDSRLPVPRTRDEIGALATTMNDLLARLQGALVRQRAFVADAGHELRTPLAVLRTELELADRPDRSRADLIEAVRSAADETDRLARLAEELLFLARSEEAPGAGPRDTEFVIPLLEQSARAFAGHAADRGVTVRVAGDHALTAPLDADQIRRAVDNLVDNGIRFAPSGSVVTVEARRNDAWLEIEVTDSGPGFPEEFLPHAFERFRRADRSRGRAEGGSGLGLAIVQVIAHTHGGEVMAENASAGPGAIVRLRLPISVDRAR
ncbi:MAG: Signal transduction histidine kinase [Actinomycetia bacterium]|nr:Signal transduction histidine kinase [Actinomycetes bacterium]